MSQHSIAICEQVQGSHRYSTKNHSYELRCPACGASRRQNMNFLGAGKVLICTGEKFERVNRIDAKRAVRGQRMTTDYGI